MSIHGQTLQHFLLGGGQHFQAADGRDTTQLKSVVVNVQLSSCRHLTSGDPPTWWELTAVTVKKSKEKIKGSSISQNVICGVGLKTDCFM